MQSCKHWRLSIWNRDTKRTDKDGEIQREIKNIQIDRQTDKKTDKETYREANWIFKRCNIVNNWDTDTLKRETDRQTDRQTNRQIGESNLQYLQCSKYCYLTHINGDRQRQIKMDREREGERDWERQTNRQKGYSKWVRDRQTNRQTDRAYTQNFIWYKVVNIYADQTEIEMHRETNKDG